MPIADTDLKFFGSANMPESNSGTNGGDIDATTKVEFTQLGATDNLEVRSTNAGDTSQTVTVYGRNAAGEPISQAYSLNGTTWVTVAIDFERITKVVVSGSHAGTIQVREKTSTTVRVTLETGFLTCRLLFINTTANASGPDVVTYTLIYLKNTHATLSWLSVIISENTDAAGIYTHGLAAAVGSAGTATNRITAPSGVTIDGTAKAVPGTNLAAGAYIGIWVAQTLAAGLAAAKTVYVPKAAGGTV